MDRPDKIGHGSFNGTGVGTNAGVSVTEAAVTGKRHFTTNIQCSGDAAAIVSVESPAGTLLYRKRFAAAFTISESFDVPLRGAMDQAMVVKISASTAACEANHQGYSTTS